MAARRAKGEGKITYRNDRDVFVAYVPTADQVPGLPKSTTGQTREEAAKNLRALRKEHDDLRGSRKGGTITVAELVKKFARAQGGSSSSPERTRKHNEWAYAKVVQAIGELNVDEVHVTDVDDGLRSLMAPSVNEAGRKTSGVKSIDSLGRVREVMVQVFDWAIDREWCVRNPARRASLPSEARPTREGVALTKDECVRILGELELHPMYAVWVTQLYLGLRSGEAAGLLVDDVDFDEGILHVRNTMRYGDTGKPLELADIKTGSRGRGRRALRMPEPVVAALRARLETLELQRTVYGDTWPKEWTKAGVVFLTDKGVPPNASSLQTPFKKAGKAIGVTVRRYDTRHTAATLLGDQGHSLEDIADILGHEDTRMARTIYQHVRVGRVLDGAVDLEG